METNKLENDISSFYNELVNSKKEYLQLFSKLQIQIEGWFRGEIMHCFKKSGYEMTTKNREVSVTNDERKKVDLKVELIEHGQDHIGSQIFGFNRILRASSSRTSLAQKINTYLKDTKQYELITNKDVLEILISICNNYEIVVIINEITNELKELINSQPLDKNKKIILLQFEKYKSVNSNVFIYKMDTLEKMANSGSAITENVHKHQTSFKRDDIRAVIPLGGHIYMPYKGKLFTATIESGGIRLEDGSIQRTPSAAAKQIRGTNTANGWVLWYQDIKCKRPIDLLRKSK